MKTATKRALGIPIDPTSQPLARMCTVCGHEGPFQPFGIGTQRADALCPVCQSLERHRLMRLALTRLSPLPRPCRLLHFAPEQAMMRFLRPLCDVYITADLMRDDVDHNLNIEDIDLDDASFDAVVCFHVLEHVDDRRALAEIFRVLRPGGLALLAVPIAEGWAQTYENDTVTDAPGRLLHFGQSDHVRWYGRDFRDRVRAAGFTLTEFTADGADAARHALIRGETIFLAHRPAAV